LSKELLRRHELVFLRLIKTNSYESIKDEILKHESLSLSKYWAKCLSEESNTTIYSNQNIVEAKFMPHFEQQSNFRAVYPTGNRNCLFNAISLILFGHESRHWQVRLLAVWQLLEKENLFRHILQRTQLKITFENFVRKIARNFTYGCDITLIAVSLAIGPPINIQYINRPSPSLKYFV
jgi:hypothetical protein